MTQDMALPILIQAGMGVGISDWRLANTVARAGHLGVVSGTSLDTILIRRLQSGDPEGHMRRALKSFPYSEIAEKIINEYFKPGGLLPNLTTSRQELIVAANFTEVCLAKENHQGKIGINYLEKIQFPILPSLFGAMLAGIDYVIMGAGIPREIPGVLDRLSHCEDVEYKLQVKNSSAEDNFIIKFSPKNIFKNNFQMIYI